MTKHDWETLRKLKEIPKRPLIAKDLTPFLSNRTLLYGHTAAGEVVHVYLKDLKIHTVAYTLDLDFENSQQKPLNLREIGF